MLVMLISLLFVRAACLVLLFFLGDRDHPRESNCMNAITRESHKFAVRENWSEFSFSRPSFCNKVDCNLLRPQRERKSDNKNKKKSCAIVHSMISCEEIGRERKKSILRCTFPNSGNGFCLMTFPQISGNECQNPTKHKIRCRDERRLFSCRALLF